MNIIKEYPKNMFEIIAETAFSHEGDFEYLKKQIILSKKAKADYIKFQVFIDKDLYIVSNHSNNEILGKYMLTKNEWQLAIDLAYSIELKILVLPLELTALKFCLKNSKKIDVFEIHSTCFNEVQMLEALSKITQKVILGVGGRLPNEVEFALNSIKKQEKDIILMYGFQSFPTDKFSLNLSRIRKLTSLFNCDIGFADHTTFENDDFHEINALAYLLGVKYFEKHIVVEKGIKRIDYESGIEVGDFLLMRENLENVEKILGTNSLFNLNENEIKYRNREKKIVSLKTIKENEIFNFSNVGYKISEESSDFKQNDIHKIVGNFAQRKILKNTIIKPEMFSPIKKI